MKSQRAGNPSLRVNWGDFAIRDGEMGNWTLLRWFQGVPWNQIYSTQSLGKRYLKLYIHGGRPGENHQTLIFEHPDVVEKTKKNIIKII